MPLLTPLTLVLLALISISMGLSYFWPPLMQVSLAALGGVAFLCGLDAAITPRRNAIEVRRVIARHLSLGDPNEVRIVVRNLRTTRIRGHVGENVPVEFQLRDVVWPFRLGGGQEQSFTYHVKPLRRGEYLFKNPTITIRGKLGLIHRSWHLKGEDAVKVYPSYLQVKKFQLLTRRHNIDMLGRKKQRSYGEGREFESLREYTTDDEYRKINWKATARRGKPIVSQFQIERNQNVIIILDAGRMMRTLAGGMSKLDYAVNAALMLAYVCVHKEDNVGLLTFGSKVTQFLPPKRGITQLNRINEALYNIRFEFAEPHYREAFHYLKRKVSKRSLLILLTDLIDDRASSVLMREYTKLYPQHLPLAVTLKDNQLEATALSRPTNREEMAQLSVAQNLVEERLRALHHLRMNGVLTLDTRPQDVTVDSINRYIEIKAKSQI
jgi:uncharacterized protein (DUF58 family)